MPINHVVLHWDGQIFDGGLLVIGDQLVGTQVHFHFWRANSVVSLIDHSDFLLAVVEKNLFSWWNVLTECDFVFVHGSWLIHLWSGEELAQCLEAERLVLTFQNVWKSTHDDVSLGLSDRVAHQVIYQNLGCLNSHFLLCEAPHQGVGEEEGVDDLMMSSPEKLVFKSINYSFSVFFIHLSNELLDYSWKQSIF